MVRERLALLRGLTLELVLDAIGRVPTTLDRALRHAGNILDGGHVTDDEDLRVPRQGEVVLDVHPARPVDLGTGLPRHDRTQRTRGNPRRPDLARRFDTALFARFILDGDPASIDSGDHRAELNLDTRSFAGIKCLGQQPHAPWR